MEKAYNGKNLVLLAIISMTVIYIAVSVYGVIQDIVTETTVFQISSTSPRADEFKIVTPILEKIKDYFNPPSRVVVPVEKRVTIKGRVIYTNGTPYAYGLVELQSAPRTTYTDKDGYFIFEDVEDGYHTISVLNQTKQVLASCTVTINRNMEIPDAVLVPISDNTYVLEVAVDVKVLEIVLEIEQGATGEPTGNFIINPEVKVNGDKPFPPDSPDLPLEPESPIEEDRGGGGGFIPDPATSKLTVHSTQYPYTKFKEKPGVADINIFGPNKRIAPGMSGTYQFTIDNRSNDFAVNYFIDLAETNNSLNIPMRYRLKNDLTGSYINGDSKWHTLDEINELTAKASAPFTMHGYMKTDYTLEWLWKDDGKVDNSFGEDHGGDVVCTLTINVSAEKR